jgi:glycosyltransferase involved in cell wall biosynthesis
MKICFYNVTASFIPGGLETYCWEVGHALAKRGHDVTIMAGARGGPARYPELRLVLFPFRIEQDWPNLGTRFRRLMERLSFARHSLAALVAGGYDAVIVNKPFDFPILSRARARGLRAVTLFRSGGTDFFVGDRHFAGAVDIWASSSRYNAEQVKARYGRHVEVIHNGVDTERFAPPAARGERSGFSLVSVGRLVGWKGHRVVIEALQGLPDSICYRLVGDGPERAALEARARELGVSARVRFEGRVGHGALPALLGECDAFAQPSIGEEAFGISVVEAMACGLPALVSDQGGLREIVEADDCGVRLPAGEVSAWRAAIGALASDASRRERMGRAARERAVAHFTWAANALRHEALLDTRRDALQPQGRAA